MWLAELFGLTPDCVAVWASAGRDANKSAQMATRLQQPRESLHSFSILLLI